MGAYWPFFNENLETEHFYNKCSRSETKSLNIFSLWLPLIGPFSQCFSHPRSTSFVCVRTVCVSLPVLLCLHLNKDKRLITEPVVMCLFDLKQEDSPQLCGLFFWEQFKGWVLCRCETFDIIVASFSRLQYMSLLFLKGS